MALLKEINQACGYTTEYIKVVGAEISGDSFIINVEYYKDQVTRELDYSLPVYKDNIIVNVSNIFELTVNKEDNIKNTFITIGYEYLKKYIYSDATSC